MTAARHGGDLKSFGERWGLKEESVLDFSANLNPLGPPPAVESLYRQSYGELSEYPDPYAREFCREVSRHFPVFPENVIAGNGSVALMDLVIRTPRPKRALVIEPCFTEYRRLLNLHGVFIHTVPLKEADRFEMSAAKILNALGGVDLWFVGHPNNPTGTALKRAEMLVLLEEAKRRRVFVMVDEAYVDWNPEESVAKEVKDDATFIVLRSLSHFYALAGIRSGFALGTRKMIEKMRTLQEPWSCNRLAQKLSVAALRDYDFRQASLAWFRSEAPWFYRELCGIAGIEVFAGKANFFLIKLKDGERRSGFLDGISQKGVYIRSAEDFSGLDAHYFRVGVRSREHNRCLLEVFRKVLSLESQVGTL